MLMLGGMMGLALSTRLLLWSLKVCADYPGAEPRRHANLSLLALQMENMTSSFEQCPGRRLLGSFAVTRSVLRSWHRHGES
jgi:hypothetical protein